MTDTTSTDKQARNAYAAKYMKAKATAVKHLIEAHRDEYQGYLATAKAEVGLKDSTQRRIESKTAKAQKLLAELAAAGVSLESPTVNDEG